MLFLILNLRFLFISLYVVVIEMATKRVLLSKQSCQSEKTLLYPWTQDPKAYSAWGLLTKHEGEMFELNLIGNAGIQT